MEAKRGRRAGYPTEHERSDWLSAGPRQPGIERGAARRRGSLWLGPLYIETLLAAGLRAEAEGKPAEAAAKRGLAAENLARYQELVAGCQSPRFTREAARLADSIAFAK